MISTSSFVFSFQDIDRTALPLVGGKGANLGELSRIEGIRVPDGFCIATDAYKKIIMENPAVSNLIDQLSLLKPSDRDKIGALCDALRKAITEITIPANIREEISRLLSRMGETDAYAVRSSATAEDLPTASFAGQHDTYLNITGQAAILLHISQCWASLFTERAVFYRLQNGFDHHKVQLAVVVQKMVFPRAAGILFTADPITGNRKVSSIDASFGLGEAMVAGLVNADNYKVQNGQVTEKKISAKKLAIYAAKEGGTKEQEITPALQQQQALTDKQILELAHLGKKIAEHFGRPQDIEWCLADDTFYIVQSRPITTLYPVPVANDQENHLYVSVGHQQMMTDAIKPFGLSFFQLRAPRPMYSAGGRLFVDIMQELSSPAGRHMLINVLGKSDPLIRDALTTITERGDFIPPLTNDDDPGKSNKSVPLHDYQAQIEYDPSIVPDLIRRSQTALDELRHNIQQQSGLDLMDFILEDIQQSRAETAASQGLTVIFTAMNAAFWINEKMSEWLGEKNVADTLSLSVPYNITSEMGLALIDVADVIRPYPEVITYLQQVQDDDFLEDMLTLNGGQESRNAIYSFLDKYGMRCAGEIDITRTRWSEKPAILAPMILSNIKNLPPGASKQKFEQGQQEALKKEQELLERLQQLPDGEEKVRETKQKITLIRNYSGYREYPKYVIVSRYFIYKQALIKTAETLVQNGVLHEKEGIYYLSFDELREVIRSHQLDHQLIHQRKEEYSTYEKLTPPRVMTSDGEIITTQYKQDNLPDGAIVGLAVSSGLIEGRARVILNMEEADLEEGDILVTKFTDPSWTPLFVAIKGLVTEVGGLMTHGAVIAREYGLPAVVGVENATRVIKDGQQIRVHGTEGYIEIL